MSQLISQLQQEVSIQVSMPSIKHDANGYAYYNTLPPNARKATIEDFTDHGNDYETNLAYLIQSELSGKYEAHRTKPGFTEANDFFAFLEKGRVFVFN